MGVDENHELSIIRKRFYTFLFIMLVSLGFIAVTYPFESTRESNHPFFNYSIMLFIYSLLRMLVDLYKKKKLEQRLKEL